GPARRPAGGARELRLRAEGRSRGGSPVRVPEAARRDRGQAGGAPAPRSAPARAAQGGLQRRVPRPLRAGGALLLPLHVADPAVSGPRRPPPALAAARAGPTRSRARLRGGQPAIPRDRRRLVAAGAPRGAGGARKPP